MTEKYDYELSNKFTEEYRKNGFVNFLRAKIESPIRVANYIFWYIIDLMVIKNNWFLRLYPNGWITSVRKEVDMAHISKADRVLHIGCGPYPITSVSVNKICGASIVTIDRNPKAVKLAKKYIKSRNIKNIKVIYTDGMDYSAKDFDVVILTNSVAPREKVLNNIFKTAKSNCRIICREQDITKDSFEKYVLRKKIVIAGWVKHASWISYLVFKTL